jgi:hypothetical protein
LHIRRSDTIAMCDTSLEKIASYLSCGAEGAEVYGNSTVLLASDESDPCYRSAIKDMVRQLGFNVVDLDATVREYLTDHVVAKDPARWSRLLNNMFQFGIITAMYWDPRMKFRLIQRKRENCGSCSNLRNQISRKGEKVAEARGGPAATVDIAQVNQTYNKCRI